MSHFPDGLPVAFETLRKGRGLLLALTGAGISAESGIPTFRGHDGFWTVGSQNYTPEEMATQAMFRRHPEAFWLWYLRRFAACLQAQPNAGHHALVACEKLLGDRFLLITQNIDGLHLRAGHRADRVYRIHGDIAHMRCGKACTRDVFDLPAAVQALVLAHPFDWKGIADHLHCPHCKALTRPHVLLFDEMYDEGWYRYQSTLAAVQKADLLLVVGTSGATNLPGQVVARAAQRGLPIVEINPEATVFTSMVEASPGGRRLVGSASEWLPRLVGWLL